MIIAVMIVDIDKYGYRHRYRAIALASDLDLDIDFDLDMDFYMYGNVDVNTGSHGREKAECYHATSFILSRFEVQAPPHRARRDPLWSQVRHHELGARGLRAGVSVRAHKRPTRLG